MRGPAALEPAPTRDPAAHIGFVEFNIPRFATERAEAAWWDRHPEKVMELLRRGRNEGKITRGGVTELAATRPITLRLASADIERAKAVAGRKGLRYQTYLRMIIHQELQQEAEKA
ncbi:MAG: hypothetical protein ACRD01_04410 [Terriglobales bacterium]